MEDKKPEENKMEIEISKYKNLVDALGDPVRVARMVLLIAIVTGILVVGIFGVVYSIKRFYPYKSINSNPYGATIIQDEDNEIIYWLFNTADLWANSGIEVKEGDIISVRTSGAFHTAIHHLVENANDNTKMENLWVPSRGGGLIDKSPLYSRDTARLKFCIASDLEYNTVLMQVVPSDVCQPNWLSNTDNVRYVDGMTDNTKDGPAPDIYDIGSGKENIRIRTNGILHFAVNDIALTPRVIDNMRKKPNYIKALELKKVKGVWFAKTKKSFDALFTTDGLDKIKPLNKHSKRNDTIISEKWNLQYFERIGLVDKLGRPIEKYWKKDALKDSRIVNTCRYSNDLIWNDIAYLKRMGLIKKDSISLKDSVMVKKYGYKVDSIWDNSYQKRIGFTKNIKKAYPIKDSISLQNSCLIRYTIRENKFNCLADSLFDSIYLNKLELLEKTWQPYELEYYRYNNFVDAWFVDNIGSFMIVIERKKVK